MWGWWQASWKGGGGGEASGGGGEPEGMSGHTRPLGVVDMMVGSGYRWRPGKGEGSKFFYKRVRVGTLGR